MHDVKDFIALVREEGFQRPNRFQVNIGIPESVKGSLEKYQEEAGDNLSISSAQVTGDIDKTLSLMAVDMNIPGYSTSSFDMKVGHTRKVLMDKTNGELNITFRCGGNMNERKLFDAWRNAIFRPNHTVAFYDGYISPRIQIITTDLEGNRIYEASVSEAYPSTVTELGLSRETNDTILTFQVTFGFRKLYNSDEDFGEKIKSYPPAYNSSVTIPEATNLITADGLPIAPISNPEFPPIYLPPAPPTFNKQLFIIDIYKNIERVKRRIENGSLSSSMGVRLLTSIVRDVNTSFNSNDPEIHALTVYANDLVFILDRL